MSKKLDELQNKEKVEQKKQIEFTEKIDELNQETDTLLEEIDKWEM
jgi:5-formyltetrahydrofolate cyclo-ligase